MVLHNDSVTFPFLNMRFLLRKYNILLPLLVDSVHSSENLKFKEIMASTSLTQYMHEFYITHLIIKLLIF